jgi:hypothetical protein
MDRVSFYFLWTLSSFSMKVHQEGSSYPDSGSFLCQIVRCNVGLDTAGASEPLFVDCLIPQAERRRDSHEDEDKRTQRIVQRKEGYGRVIGELIF